MYTSIAIGDLPSGCVMYIVILEHCNKFLQLREEAVCFWQRSAKKAAVPVTPELALMIPLVLRALILFLSEISAFS